MKQVIVRPAAAAAIEDAYRWYESQRAGLGDEFLEALGVTRERVLEQPEAFPVRARDGTDRQVDALVGRRNTKVILQP